MAENSELIQASLHGGVTGLLTPTNPDSNAVSVNNEMGEEHLQPVVPVTNCETVAIANQHQAATSANECETVAMSNKLALEICEHQRTLTNDASENSIPSNCVNPNVNDISTAMNSADSSVVSDKNVDSLNATGAVESSFVSSTNVDSFDMSGAMESSLTSDNGLDTTADKYDGITDEETFDELNENGEDVLSNDEEVERQGDELQSVKREENDVSSAAFENGFDEDTVDFTVSDEENKIPAPKRALKRRLVDVECTDCNKLFISYDHLKRHRRVHTKGRTKVKKPRLGAKQVNKRYIIDVNCDECGKHFKRNDHLKRHKMVHDKEKSGLYEAGHRIVDVECPDCGKRFRRMDLLKRHQRFHEKEKAKADLLLQGIDPATVDLESVADEKVKRKRYRKLIEINCNVCGKHFNRMDHLRRHESVHMTDRPFKCHLCDMAFTRAERLKRHIRKHDHQCERCSRSFSKAELLEKHQLSHLFKCEFCGERYETKDLLKEHVVIHNDEMPNICDVCGKRFHFRKQLQNHKECHKAQDPNFQPFTCEICGQLCKTKKLLYRHQVGHTGRRDFICQICGKAFKVRVDLTKHNIIHFGTRKHKCQLCGKGFYQAKDLKRHLTIHGDATPFTCEICNKGFKVRYNYNMHLFTHSGKHPFECKYCLQHFRSGIKLKTHLETHPEYREQVALLGEAAMDIKMITPLQHIQKPELNRPNTMTPLSTAGLTDHGSQMSESPAPGIVYSENGTHALQQQQLQAPAVYAQNPFTRLFTDPEQNPAFSAQALFGNSFTSQLFSGMAQMPNAYQQQYEQKASMEHQVPPTNYTQDSIHTAAEASRAIDRAIQSILSEREQQSVVYSQAVWDWSEVEDNKTKLKDQHELQTQNPPLNNFNPLEDRPESDNEWGDCGVGTDLPDERTFAQIKQEVNNDADYGSQSLPYIPTSTPVKRSPKKPLIPEHEMPTIVMIVPKSSNEKRSTECPECHKVLSRFDHLRTHVKHVHCKLIVVEREGEPKTRPEKTKTCQFCNKKFGRFDHLTRHLRFVHKQDIPKKVRMYRPVSELKAMEIKDRMENASFILYSGECDTSADFDETNESSRVDDLVDQSGDASLLDNPVDDKGAIIKQDVSELAGDDMPSLVDREEVLDGTGNDGLSGGAEEAFVVIKESSPNAETHDQPFFAPNIVNDPGSTSSGDGPVAGTNVVSQQPERSECISQQFEVGEMVKTQSVVTEQVNQQLRTTENVFESSPVTENIAQSQVTKHIPQQPDVAENIVPQLDVVENIVQQPNVPENIVQQPNVAENIIQQPNVTENIVQQPNVAENGVQQAGVAEHIVQQSGVAKNVVQQSGVAENVVQQSGVAENVVQQSGVAENVVQQTGVAENVVQQAGVTENIVEQPDVAENIVHQKPQTEVPEMMSEGRNIVAVQPAGTDATLNQAVYRDGVEVAIDVKGTLRATNNTVYDGAKEETSAPTGQNEEDLHNAITPATSHVAPEPKENIDEVANSTPEADDEAPIYSVVDNVHVEENVPRLEECVTEGIQIANEFTENFTENVDHVVVKGEQVADEYIEQVNVNADAENVGLKGEYNLRSQRVLRRKSNKVCTVCGRKFKRTDHLRRHLKQVHKRQVSFSTRRKIVEIKPEIKLKPMILKIKGDTTPRLIKCPVCDKELGRMRALVQHCERVHLMVITIHRTAPSKPTTGATGHVQPKVFKCPICDKTFKRKDHLTRHTRSHSGDKPFQCDRCPMAFTRKEYLDNHLRMHTPKCELCDMVFGGKVELKQHLIECHENDKPNICDICGRDFQLKMQLNNHLKSHKPDTNTKTYTCEICGQVFRQKRLLERHHVNHTGRRDFVCQVCGKAFKMKVDLYKHSVYHSAVKNYQCPKCPLAFYQSKDLRRHLFNHSDIKPHKCDICNRAFKNKQNLKVHVYTHTGKKPHQCKFCLRSFRSGVKLQAHLYTHPEYKPPQPGEHSGLQPRLDNTSQPEAVLDIVTIQQVVENTVTGKHPLTTKYESPLPSNYEQMLQVKYDQPLQLTVQSQAQRAAEHAVSVQLQRAAEEAAAVRLQKAVEHAASLQRAAEEVAAAQFQKAAEQAETLHMQKAVEQAAALQMHRAGQSTASLQMHRSIDNITPAQSPLQRIYDNSAVTSVHNYVQRTVENPLPLATVSAMQRAMRSPLPVSYTLQRTTDTPLQSSVGHPLQLTMDNNVPLNAVNVVQRAIENQIPLNITNLMQRTDLPLQLTTSILQRTDQPLALTTGDLRATEQPLSLTTSNVQRADQPLSLTTSGLQRIDQPLALTSAGHVPRSLENQVPAHTAFNAVNAGQNKVLSVPNEYYADNYATPEQARWMYQYGVAENAYMLQKQ